MCYWLIAIAGLIFGIWFLRMCLYSPEERLKKLREVDQRLANDLVDLGKSYLKGEGVSKDPKKAYEFFCTAAHLGHPYAQSCMSKFDKISADTAVPKEVQAALGVLQEANYLFDDSTAFPLIKKNIEKMVLKEPDKFADFIRTGPSPRLWVYRAIVNVSDNLLATGRYHYFRGALDPTGTSILLICEAALDKLVELNDMDVECANKQKATVRNNIKGIGM